MKVGFIGLGHMGFGMAENLLRAGHDLTVYNRTPGKEIVLLQKGAHRASQAAEACRGEAVFTMLADDHAVESLVYGDRGILAPPCSKLRSAEKPRDLYAAAIPLRA
jgi:3-hydroxyisobutyrate dehydrogenase-like beta-hydroxyacid dehydrogenase